MRYCCASVPSLMASFLLLVSVLAIHSKAVAGDCYQTFVDCTYTISTTPKTPDFGVDVFVKDAKWAITSSSYQNAPGWVVSTIARATPNASSSDLSYSALKYTQQQCKSDSGVKRRSTVEATSGKGVRKGSGACGSPETLLFIDYKITYKDPKTSVPKDWTTTVLGDGPDSNFGFCGEKAGDECNGL